MEELTIWEKEMLDNICQNPISFGAFTGMIFNALDERVRSENFTNDDTIKYLIKSALSVRVIALKMSK